MFAETFWDRESMSADHPEYAEASRRFARLALEAITRAGHVTDAEIAAAGGPSDSYMTMLRRAAHEGAWLRPMRRSTQRKIEKVANWAAGSAQKVWDGGDPEEAQDMTGFATWEDMRNPRYDARHMAARMDDLERRLEGLDTRPDMTFEMADGSLILIEVKRLTAEGEETPVLANLQLIEHLVNEAYKVLDVQEGSSTTNVMHLSAADNQDLLAARHGQSDGRELRRIQDEAAEVTQDPGGEDPA